MRTVLYALIGFTATALAQSACEENCGKAYAKCEIQTFIMNPICGKNHDTCDQLCLKGNNKVATKHMSA